MFYSVGIFRTSSPGDSISSNSERTAPWKWGKEPGYIEVLQQRVGSLNIRRLLLKKTRNPKLSAFLCMGRYKSLGSLKSFLWYIPQLSGPVSWIFTSWVFSGLTIGSGCSPIAARWQVFIPSWVPSGLTIGSGCSHWWQCPPLLTDVKVLHFSVSTNDVSNFLKTCTTQDLCPDQC